MSKHRAAGPAVTDWQFGLNQGEARHRLDPDGGYRTYLVAVVATSQEDLINFLVASPLGPDSENGVIDSWWIAEDDREDRSDNDSAIFVPRGGQADFASLRNQYLEYHAEEWREDGYPYADTDVSGEWFRG